jgi:hypothetical protein
MLWVRLWRRAVSGVFERENRGNSEGQVSFKERAEPRKRTSKPLRFQLRQFAECENYQWQECGGEALCLFMCNSKI